MRIVTLSLPDNYIRIIDGLIGEQGIYPSRSELLRVAIREYLISELNIIEQLKKGNAFDEKTMIIKQQQPSTTLLSEEQILEDFYRRIKEKKRQMIEEEKKKRENPEAHSISHFQKNIKKTTITKPIEEEKINLKAIPKEELFKNENFEELGGYHIIPREIKHMRDSLKQTEEVKN